MYKQIEKSKENKSRTVANSVTQKKSDVKQGLGFVDNRPEGVAQRKLQEMMNDSTEENKYISNVEHTHPLSNANETVQRVLIIENTAYNEGDADYLRRYYPEKDFPGREKKF